MVSRSPAAMRPGTARPWAVVVTPALAVVAVAALAVHFLFFLDYALAALRYPFELDYGEGIVMQQALLIPGPRAYGDITRFPFLVFHYPPLYHLVSRGLAALGLDLLTAGRAVSLASSLGIGALAAALAFRAARAEAGRRAAAAGAAVAGLAVFTWYPVMAWAPLMRVDMLAIALSFVGVWCAVCSTRRPWLLYLGMAAFVGSVYAKQTCIAAPLATIPVMLAADPRRTLWAVLFGAILGGGALAALEWATGGAFLTHVVVYNLNRYSLRAALDGVKTAGPHLGYLLLAATALAVGLGRLGLGRAWTDVAAFRRDLARSEPKRLFLILAAYAALTTAMLATVGKSGSQVNYLIEWMCVASVLVGLLVSTLLTPPAENAAGPASPRRLPAALIFILLIAQVLKLPASRPLDAAGDTIRLADLASLVTEIRAADKPILSDDMVLLILAGKEVMWEPAIFAELAATGRWDESRIVSMIEARAFAFIVTQGSPGMAMFDSRYTPAVLRAILTAYPGIEEHFGRTVHRPAG